MARLADFEKARRQRKRRILLRNIVVFVAFALALVLIVGLLQQVGSMDLRTAYSDIRAEIVSGSGYPVSLPGRVTRLTPVSDAMALLGETNVFSFNASGRQIMDEPHGMSAQMAVTSRERMLLYDRGGQKVTIFSKSTSTLTFNSDFIIYSADIADNGNFATVTSSDEHLMRVTVYNKDGDDIFIWKSAEKPIISVALADNRDVMMVGCVDAVDGAYVSSISRYQFSIDQEMAQVSLKDELLLYLDFTSANYLRAITDQRIIVFNNDLKEVASFSHEGTLDYFSGDPGKLLAVSLGNYSQDHQVTVVVLDETLNEQSRFTIDKAILSVKTDANLIYIASKDHVDIYRPDGTCALSQGIVNLHDISPNGTYLYYLTGEILDRIDVSPFKLVTDGAGGASSGDETASDPSDTSSAWDDAFESMASSTPESDDSDSSTVSVLPDDDDLDDDQFLIKVESSSSDDDSETG